MTDITCIIRAMGYSFNNSLVILWRSVLLVDVPHVVFGQ